MVLVQKQKLFTWFDSYNIYDEFGNIFFKVKGRLSWGHKVEIYDAHDKYLGKIVEKIVTFLPKYRFFIGENEIGCLRKMISFFRPNFELDYNGWEIVGDFFQWNYTVMHAGNLIMTCDKKVLSIRDTYRLNIINSQNALLCLMIALSLDIDKCSRKNN